MAKIYTENELKDIADDLSRENLKSIITFWGKNQNKWEELNDSNKRHYMDVGTWGDLFHQEILSVDPTNKLMHVRDWSQRDKYIVNIVREIPDEVFEILNDAIEYYSKKYPLF